MTSRTPSADFDALLEHADWLKRLARRLVLDDARADDLMQEVWLAALRSPTEVTAARGWLRTVLVQKLHRGLASEQSRRVRELRASRPEALDESESAAARSLRLRELHDEVLQLDEPYRDVLLLKFFEDLPPREISARLGLPVNTVTTRVQRGLERLRRRLDRRYEDRSNWCLAFIPLAFSHKEILRRAGGASLFSAVVVVAIAGLLLGLPLSYSWLTGASADVDDEPQLTSHNSRFAESIARPSGSVHEQALSDLAVRRRSGNSTSEQETDDMQRHLTFTRSLGILAQTTLYATVFTGAGEARPLLAQAFGSQQVITTAVEFPYSVHAADLDGDGDMDVLSASVDSNEIAWYQNNGSGSFGSKITITNQALRARCVHAADLDGDGLLDVLSASERDDKIAWYKNLGGGSFGSEQVVTLLALDAWTVSTADLDGDGDADVLSTSVADHTVAWYENDGAGTFGPRQEITTQPLVSSSISAFAMDLDGDGNVDVLSASSQDNTIAWYRNLGAGTFGPQVVISNTAIGATSVCAQDLDGDGAVDVLAGSFGDSTVAWFKNLGGGSFRIQASVVQRRGQCLGRPRGGLRWRR